MFVNKKTDFFVYRYLYYLVADSTSSLHVLDLRQESASASSVLSGARSRRQTSGNSLSDLSLAPALALEPTTGDLLVSDAASGNILSCSLNCSGSVLSCSSNCAVLVDNQQLLGGNTEIGILNVFALLYAYTCIIPIP